MAVNFVAQHRNNPRFHFYSLLSITKAQWYESNKDHDRNLNIKYVKKEIMRFSASYNSRLQNHPNCFPIDLLSDEEH